MGRQSQQQVLKRQQVPGRGRGPFARQPNQSLNARVGASRLLTHRSQFGIHAEQACSAVTQDVGDFLSLEHEIDWNEQGAESRYGKPDSRKSVRIPGKNGDSVAAADLLRCQACGELAANAIKLRVSPNNRAATDRDLVRRPGGGAPQ